MNYAEQYEELEAVVANINALNVTLAGDEDLGAQSLRMAAAMFRELARLAVLFTGEWDRMADEIDREGA